MARSAYVFTGRSLGRDEGIGRRVKRALRNRLATWYAEAEKDSTYAPVSEATEAGREASADLIVGDRWRERHRPARRVAIFLGESGSPFDLRAQYPEGKSAYRPAAGGPPKPPIFERRIPPRAEELLEAWVAMAEYGVAQWRQLRTDDARRGSSTRRRGLGP